MLQKCPASPPLDFLRTLLPFPLHSRWCQFRKRHVVEGRFNGGRLQEREVPLLLWLRAALDRPSTSPAGWYNWKSQIRPSSVHNYFGSSQGTFLAEGPSHSRSWQFCKKKKKEKKSELKRPRGVAKMFWNTSKFWSLGSVSLQLRIQTRLPPTHPLTHIHSLTLSPRLCNAVLLQSNFVLQRDCCSNIIPPAARLVVNAFFFSAMLLLLLSLLLQFSRSALSPPSSKRAPAVIARVWLCKWRCASKPPSSAPRPPFPSLFFPRPGQSSRLAERCFQEQ